MYRSRLADLDMMITFSFQPPLQIIIAASDVFTLTRLLDHVGDIAKQAIVAVE